MNQLGWLNFFFFFFNVALNWKDLYVMVKRNRKEEGIVLLNPTSSWLHSHRLEHQTASCTVGTVDTCLYLAPKSPGRGPFDTPKLFAYILREKLDKTSFHNSGSKRIKSVSRRKFEIVTLTMSLK